MGFWRREKRVRLKIYCLVFEWKLVGIMQSIDVDLRRIITVAYCSEAYRIYDVTKHHSPNKQAEVITSNYRFMLLHIYIR